MKRRVLFAAYLALLRVAVLTCFATAAFPATTTIASHPKPAVDLRQHPTGGKTPVVMSVGLYITNLVAIDESRESFEVAGYLIGKWQDPRLALPPASDSAQSADPNSIREFRTEDIWSPPIQAANSISHKTNSYSLEVDRNGNVTYVERFDAVLSNEYPLRTFPFDTQVLRLEFQPFRSTASGIEFAAQPLSSTGIDPDQHTDLASWRMMDIRYTNEKVVTGGAFPETHEALFQIVVKRRSGFYIWKIFLPLLMMTIIPLSVFWLDVKEFDWQLKIPMTMLLSMVAFEFAIARDLPKIGYVTFLDAVFLVSFAFCFLCTFEITIVFLMQQRGLRPLAEKIHAAGRWAYPLAYFGALVVLALFFLI